MSDEQTNRKAPRRSRKMDPAIRALRAYVRLMQGQPDHVHAANVNYLWSAFVKNNQTTCSRKKGQEAALTPPQTPEGTETPT